MPSKSFRPVLAEVGDVLCDLDGFIRRAGLYLLVVVLASGGAFVFQNLMAVDQWWAYADQAGWQTTEPVSMGRPLFALISKLAQSAFPLHPFDTVIFYTSLVIFTFTLFRRWSGSRWARLLLISLFLTSPLMVEHLHFTVNQIPLAIAFLLLAYWFITVTVHPAEGRVSAPAVLTGAVAAALALTIRHELVFVMTGAAVIEVSRALLQRAEGVGRGVLVLVASLFMTALLSVLIIVGALALSGSGFLKGGNYGIDHLIATREQFASVLARLFTYWSIFLFGEQYLIPLALKLLVWFMAALAALQSIFAGDGRRLAVLVVGGALLSFLPLTLGLLSTGFPYLYAGVFPLALFACFVAAVAITEPRARWGARGAVFVAGVLVVAISAANLSSAQVRISNLNRRDFSTITQMLGAIRATGVEDWKIALLGSYSDGSVTLWARSREQASVFEGVRPLAQLLTLVVAERNPEQRVFRLSESEAASLQPELDKLPEGSSTLLRLDRNKFVILLK